MDHPNNHLLKTKVMRMHFVILNKEAEAKELLTALQEARDMLKDLGMHDDSVGLVGINNVIKKYENE